jgi:arsenate reductase
VAHISFPDPAKATGSEEERLAVFRQVRDDICHKVLTYLAETTSASPSQEAV